MISIYNFIIKTEKKEKILVDSIWRKDKNKKEQAENMGYKLIYIWEKDYTSDKNFLHKFLIENEVKF